jgi:hypothetical protein
MPDTETVNIPLSGINPDLQRSFNSGKLAHCFLLQSLEFLFASGPPDGAILSGRRPSVLTPGFGTMIRIDTDERRAALTGPDRPLGQSSG